MQIKAPVQHFKDNWKELILLQVTLTAKCSMLLPN